MRVTVESCHQLRISDLQTRIRKIILRDWPESTEEEVYNHTLEELKKFTTNDQTFEYEAQRNYLGGYRWYFLCPKCKKRVNRMILPPEGTSFEMKYLCKVCHGIRNTSVVMGQSAMYTKVTRPLKRMKEIEDRIAAGHLPMDKAKELMDEYDLLEGQLKAEPEYRLYMFKKRHGMIPMANNPLISQK